MAKRNGGIIGPDNVPAGPLGSAGGVWRLEDAFNAQKAGTWPVILGYQIPNSLRFNRTSSDYLSRTPASAGSTTKGTFSLWFKLSELAATRSTDYQIFYSVSDGGSPFLISIDSSDKLHIAQYNGASYDFQYVSTQVLRDMSAWYHLVVAIDTTQGTASNRVRTYLNGSEITNWGTQTNPSSSLSVIMFKNSSTNIGRYAHSSTQYYSGYIAEQYGIDGQQLTPSSFGQTDSTTGIWTPIAYTGTYGTNGFYLKFANSASLGTDSSGNANNFTVNNLTSVDQSYDSPTNNFCTLNPLNATLTNSTITEGNLQFAGGSQTVNYAFTSGTIAPSKGKWYWEVKAVDNAEIDQVGVAKADLAQFANISNSGGLQATTYGGKGVQFSNGNKVGNGSGSTYMAGLTANQILTVALDLDNGKIYFGTNGSWADGSGNTNQTFANAVAAFTDLTVGDAYIPAHNMRDFGGSNPGESEYNFGYPPFTISSGNADANGFGNFEYAVPSGYYALCSKNLAVYG